MVGAVERGGGALPPRQVVFVDALPRNALGKVLKYRVRERLIEAEG